MTFYQAVRHLKAHGYTMIRKYTACEIWEKGNTTISLPDLPSLPYGVSRKIKAAR